jgi:hypothetical protein
MARREHKYKVNVCRIAYSNLTIEVWAKSQEEAEQRAEDQAGNHSFPNEHTSEYKAQGATRIE